MSTQTNQTASYKGKTYKLLWIGATKYGRRAHLAFRDGSKDFWVDASLVSTGESDDRRGNVSYSHARHGGPILHRGENGRTWQEW